MHESADFANLKFDTMSLLKYERVVMHMVLKDRRYFFLLALLSSIFTAIYLVLLPSLPNGTINPMFIEFITPIQIIFSFLFGSDGRRTR